MFQGFSGTICYLLRWHYRLDPGNCDVLLCCLPLVRQRAILGSDDPENTLPEFLYLSMAPNFKPKDPLLLPRFSKKDNTWGIYVDVLVDEVGNVVA